MTKQSHLHKDCFSAPGFFTGKLVMTLLVLLASVLIFSCGRKGPPTLKAYEKPESPSGLTAVHRERRIILSWSYPGKLRTSIKGFQVLRSEGEGFERRAFVDSDQGSFADEEFILDVSYRYQVLAENLKGVLSAGSEVITIVPKQLSPPPDDIRFAVKSDGVDISWKGSGEDVCYNIYKSPEKGKYGDISLNKEPVCAATFRDGSLSPEQAVYYTIRSLHNTPLKDEGFPSSEVVVKPADFIPSPPSEPVTAKLDDKIYLMWKESPESWVRGYRIYRKREGEEAFTPVGVVKVPAFTDKELGGKKMWYMIKALGPSTESQPVTVEVP